MSYNAHRADGRPDQSLPRSAPSAGKHDAFIEEIIKFAKEDAKDAWEGLGLDEIPVPKVKFKRKKQPFRAETLFNNATGKAKVIHLDEYYLASWTKIEFAQVFMFEMGNIKKAPLHSELFKKIDKMSKDEYVRAVERIEWDFVSELLKYVDAPNSPFKGHSAWTARPKDFEDYYKNYSQQHRQVYEAEWDYYNP